jgi:hypothetical protein|eukprot:COSAG01_NODE_3417_length_6121_cov_33.897376_1_plen_147_part_00
MATEHGLVTDMVAELRHQPDRPSALSEVSAGGTANLPETAAMLNTVDQRALDLASSVDALLDTLSTKMSDISSCSKDYSRLYDNLVSGTEQSIELAITQMSCLISKCHCLNGSLARVDDMAAEVAQIKDTLTKLEKALAHTVLKSR